MGLKDHFQEENIFIYFIYEGYSTFMDGKKEKYKDAIFFLSQITDMRFQLNTN